MELSFLGTKVPSYESSIIRLSIQAPVKCGLVDRRTCNLQTENLRTATADPWVNSGPLMCGPNSIEAVGKKHKTDSKDANDDEDGDER